MNTCIICGEEKRHCRSNLCPRCKQRLSKAIYQGPIRMGDWFSHLGYVWDETSSGKILMRYEDIVSPNDAVCRAQKPPKYREVTENLLRTYTLRAENPFGKELRPARKNNATKQVGSTS